MINSLSFPLSENGFISPSSEFLILVTMFFSSKVFIQFLISDISLLKLLCFFIFSKFVGNGLSKTLS